MSRWWQRLRPGRLAELVAKGPGVPQACVLHPQTPAAAEVTITPPGQAPRDLALCHACMEVLSGSQGDEARALFLLDYKRIFGRLPQEDE